MRLNVEVGVFGDRHARLDPVEWVDIGNEVAAGPVCLNELHDPGVFV